MKKLNSNSFRILIIAIIVSIGVSIAGGVMAFINYKPFFEAAFKTESEFLSSVLYLFLRTVIPLAIVILLNIVWLASLIKDKKNRAKRTYLMIMLGFHIFFAMQNIASLCDTAFLTTMLGLTDLLKLTDLLGVSNSLIAELVLVCIRLATSILVFVGYIIQKKARVQTLPPPNYYPSYPQA